MDRTMSVSLSDAISREFAQHAERLRCRARERRQGVRLRNVVSDRTEREAVSEVELLGKRQPQDEFAGDVNLRTLRMLLKLIDERGFERCALRHGLHNVHFALRFSHALRSDCTPGLLTRCNFTAPSRDRPHVLYIDRTGRRLVQSSCERTVGRAAPPKSSYRRHDALAKRFRKLATA